MKESYGEGLATHAGPESCAVDREVGGEALTGGSVSRATEPRNGPYFWVPAPYGGAWATREWIELARSLLTWRGRRPRAYVDAPHAGSGRPRTRPDLDGGPVRAENPKGAHQR